MNKLGQNIKPGFLIVILIIAAVLFVPAIKEAVIGFLGGTGTGGGTGGGTGTGTGSGICPAGVTLPADAKTTVTIASESIYAPGTTVGTSYYWINGVRKGHVTSGGSFSASPGDKVKVLFAENSTTYYGSYKEYTVPCSGTYEIFQQLYPMSTSEDWSPSITNDAPTAGTSNSLANQTISAGEVKNIDLTLETAWKKALGSPYLKGQAYNTLCCEYNVTAYDKLELTSNGNLVSTISNPILLPTEILSNIQWKCWPLDPIWSGPTASNGLGQEADWSGSLRIDADDTYDPTGPTGGIAWDPAGDIYCRVDDIDYDLHATTYDLLKGVEDEDNNNLGITAIVMNFTIEVT